MGAGEGVRCGIQVPALCVYMGRTYLVNHVVWCVVCGQLYDAVTPILRSFLEQEECECRLFFTG